MDEITTLIETSKQNILWFDYLWFLWNILSLLTFEWVVKMILIYFFIVWIAIIIWVTKDIINRTNNIIYQIIAILTVLVGTPLGVVIYLLIRPSKTLFEKYYEESSIEEEQEQPRISKSENIFCFECGEDIIGDFHFCPNCNTKLKTKCKWCKKEISTPWNNCPYCGKKQKENQKNDLSTQQQKIIIQTKSKSQKILKKSKKV